MKYDSPLKDNTPEALQMEELLKDVGYDCLYRKFKEAKNFLVNLDLQSNVVADLAKQTILAYIEDAYSRYPEHANAFADCCVKLAELPPEKRDYWMEKQTQLRRWR